ncbi:MAG: hypothetical protein V4505_21105 [Pseudomonadota bacterium]
MPNPTITRRHNTLLLHRRFLEEAIAAGLPAKGLDQAFAQKLEISPSMWSQVKSARPIGDTLARQIECHCGVEAGWLDRPDLAAEGPDPAEERFIGLARLAWRAANARGKRALARALREAAAQPRGPAPASIAR